MVYTLDLTLLPTLPRLQNRHISRESAEMDLAQFYQGTGFQEDPFQHTNAEIESLLPRYFVPPPYFPSVWGDPRNPSPTVVLAPRGGGKTAQKLMIEQRALRERNVLPVSYNRYDFKPIASLDDVSSQFHVANLCRLITAALLLALDDDPNRRAGLTTRRKEQLRAFADIYLSTMSDAALTDIAESLKPLSERSKELWNSYLAGPLAKAFHVFTSAWGWSAVEPDLHISENHMRDGSVATKGDLTLLHQLSKTSGFDSIYILVDKADETSMTGNDAKATYRLLEPLVRDLDLLAMEGYGFKLFLWERVEPFYRQYARPDRVQQYHLQWTQAELKKMLQGRLRTYSDERVSSVGDFCTGVDNVDELIIAFSQKSPRNTIRICERVVSEQLRVDPEGTAITQRAIDLGIREYCEQTLKETVIENTISDLKRVGKVEFTIPYLADTVLRTSNNACRNKVNGWINAGLVKQVGEIQTGKRSGRPIYNYRIVDVRAAYLATGMSSPSLFVKEHLLGCQQCQADQIIQLEHIAPGQNVVCSECNGSIGL